MSSDPALFSGAKAVHVRISSPPVTDPCFYGMDFPSKEELLANKYYPPHNVTTFEI